MSVVKKIVFVTLFCIFSVLTLPVWASYANTKDIFDTSGFQISAYGGVSNVTITPGDLKGFGETDSLHPNGRKQNDFTRGLGGAYRFILPASVQKILHDIAAGVDLLSFQTIQKGHVFLFDSHFYDNYYYTMPIKSIRLMADGELTFQPLGSYLYPFIVAGVGVARNTANYYDTPVIPGTIGLSINSNTQNQFAYTAGVGMKFLLPQHVILSFHYLYVDLGNAQTSQTATVPLAAPVTIPITTNTWLVDLTYLF